jgi:hypothetical protein
MGDEIQDEARMPPIDPSLRAALSARFGETPSARDLASLEARISEAARFRLASRARRSWRAPAIRWAGVLIPAGLAASLLLAAGLLFSPGDTTSDGPAMDDVVAVGASSALPSDPLSLTDQETFLSTMLGQESQP